MFVHLKSHNNITPIASSMLHVRSWVRSVLVTSRGSSTLDRLTDMMMESEFTIECCVRRHHIYKRRSLLGRQEPPLQSSCTYSAFKFNSSSMCEIVPRPQRQRHHDKILAELNLFIIIILQWFPACVRYVRIDNN